jgi:DNA invertase Pin-like site-specific DNA recombinase
MEIVRSYADEGKSGVTLDGRAGLVSLLSAVQGGSADFKAILVYDISRWGRFQDADEGAYWEFVCKRAGVMIHYCAEQFTNDGSLPSHILKSLKRTMAAEYSRELSAKVFAGQCRLINLGYRQGGPAGYGWRRLLLDHENRPKGILTKGQMKCLQSDRVILIPGPEEEQTIVREIFHAFVNEGKTQTRIADDLNVRGIASGLKRPWTCDSVHEILANPKYIGANVYNRSSFKLNRRRVSNPEPLWIRREGAFTPIVSPELFRKAAQILESVGRKATDDRMLDDLRSLLKRTGRLSAHLIDNAEGLHSSRSYSVRFGGLRGAYKRLGYIPMYDTSFRDVVEAIDAQRAQCLEQISSHLKENGADVELDDVSGTMRINEYFTLRLIVVRCVRHQGRPPRWRVRQNSTFECDLTIVARMDEENSQILDYYLFPARDRLRKGLLLAKDNSIVLDVYRSKNLDQVYRILRRKQVGELT